MPIYKTPKAKLDVKSVVSAFGSGVSNNATLASDSSKPVRTADELLTCISELKSAPVATNKG